MKKNKPNDKIPKVIIDKSASHLSKGEIVNENPSVMHFKDGEEDIFVAENPDAIVEMKKKFKGLKNN